MYDRNETARRGYTDPKSKVRFDGTEVLGPKDWKKRVGEVMERAGGICEWICKTSLGWPLGRCHQFAQDAHHIKPRSKGRDDRSENLMALCRFHHNQLDPRKVRWSGSRELGCSADVVEK